MSALKYRDLPTTIGTSVAQPLLACVNEDCDDYAIPYSAERGDYFWAANDEDVLCGMCDESMRLVEFRTEMVRL